MEKKRIIHDVIYFIYIYHGIHTWSEHHYGNAIGAKHGI
ncbi:hypothetical protein LGAA44_430004 [Leuconostoc gasicomitatum]|nr:hypothetical protein LGAA44_430004 [Leuconostoc gasicomitatum]